MCNHMRHGRTRSFTLIEKKVREVDALSKDEELAVTEDNA